MYRACGPVCPSLATPVQFGDPFYLLIVDDHNLSLLRIYSIKTTPEWVTQVSGFTELVSTIKRIHKHITIHHPPQTSISLHLESYYRR